MPLRAQGRFDFGVLRAFITPRSVMYNVPGARLFLIEFI